MQGEREVFPLVNEQLLPVGNFHMVKPARSNSSVPTPYFFRYDVPQIDGEALGDNTALYPVSRIESIPGIVGPGTEFTGTSATDKLIQASTELVGDKKSEGLTTRVMREMLKSIKILQSLEVPHKALRRLLVFQSITEAQEVAKMRVLAQELGEIVQGAGDLWVVGKYHQEGKFAEDIRLRDAHFAANVVGFTFDAERRLIIPIVRNAFGTQEGFLPRNITLRDEADSWLYMYDEEYEPLNPLNLDPQLDISFDSEDVGLRL